LAGKKVGLSLPQSTFGGGGTCGSSVDASSLAFLGLEEDLLVFLGLFVGLSSNSDSEPDCPGDAFRLTPRFEGEEADFTAFLAVSVSLRALGGIIEL